ncbi:hypothetical protein SARC_14745 [Sphaeroforma arctica JP610]|uniref:Uncharacterized protein n=1 Tax=Sphaeroforma arctica JP610 TaxID=667725 RepID=A0A0L0F7N6_9EUKA|nr:hypothetical protein SARC_14745 [Sphaeroforma arctica JP610]KNC72694.1 hypothetical protein SARC_14745 [Sphaeroforma arctica JP610]|eukprot:XP_014146596.1 hypothetical protein SARC_14745 [Sphaeroforma arctica JP610]
MNGTQSLRTDLGNSQEKDIAHILMDIDENCDEVEVILTEKEEDMEVMEADIQNLADELRRYEKQKSNTGVKLVPIVLV